MKEQEKLTKQAAESAEKAVKPGKAGKKRKKKKSRIKSTILLFCLIIVLILIGAAAVILLKKGGLSSDVLPYDVNREFTEIVLPKEHTRGISFARDLCVGEGNVELEKMSLDYEQTGVLMDLSNKKVMYACDMYDRVYPASLTKIMTALIVLRNANLEDEVVISANDLYLEEGSQVCGFEAGDHVTVLQLLNCLLVYSGNDAAMALANHVGGSEQNFVDLMNNCAIELGMTGTHFCNPHGLHVPDHYTTTYDIYLMLKEAYKYPLFTEITSLPSYDVVYKQADGEDASIHMEATDYYLNGEATPPRNVTVLGGKTGTTDQAGNCLALITQNSEGKPFISIVLGAYDKPRLYEEMSSLLQNINTDK